VAANAPGVEFVGVRIQAEFGLFCSVLTYPILSQWLPKIGEKVSLVNSPKAKHRTLHAKISWRHFSQGACALRRDRRCCVEPLERHAQVRS